MMSCVPMMPDDPRPPCADVLCFVLHGVILRLLAEDCMRRREFITVLGGAAVAWPLGARAQQSAVPVVGYFHFGGAHPDELAAFHRGLSELGYVEGRNVTVEYRWANNEVGRLSELAADLVRRRVRVDLPRPHLAARAARDPYLPSRCSITSLARASSVFGTTSAHPQLVKRIVQRHDTWLEQPC
jgi:hypothetical protein